ncbi:MAG: copper resistance protein CopC, partial [Candidatus Limnocylindrales bacterium]
MTTRHRTRLRLAFAGLVLTGLVTPGAILAHAALDGVMPADQSTVTGPPAGIVMTFVENLDPAKSSIRLVDAAGAVVAEGGIVPASNPRELDLA